MLNTPTNRRTNDPTYKCRDFMDKKYCPLTHNPMKS